MSKAILKVKIEDKIYTKTELIKAVTDELEKILNDSKYGYVPEDLDNFYTDYVFKEIK